MTFNQFFGRFGNSKNGGSLLTNEVNPYDTLNSPSLSASPVSALAVENESTGIKSPEEQPIRVPVQRITADVNEDIENLDRLRNRAVIDGVSEVTPEYMMKAIDAYVDIKIAAENTISDYDHQITELRTVMQERISKIQELKQPSTEYVNRFTFLGIQIFLFMLVCLGGFFIIYHTVATSDYFRLSQPWICFIISLGIGCVGICNFFAKSSFLGSDKVESAALKTALELVEQLGMSLVASTLVMIIALQSQSVGLSITLGFFTFFLSILGGKLLSGAVTNLHQQFIGFRSYKQYIKNRKENINFLQSENKATNDKIDLLLADKAKADVQYMKNRSDIEKLKAQKDFYIKFYMHYFHLARTYKSYLTPEQASAIQSSVFK